MSGNSCLTLFAPPRLLTGAVVARQLVSYAGAACTVGQKALGVSATDGSIGDYVPVAAMGTALAICGAAVTVGDALQSDASGHVVGITSGVFVGNAMGTTTTPGQIVEVFLAGPFPTVQGAFNPKDVLQIEIPTLVGTGVTHAIVPHAGVVSKIYSVIDAALGTGDATLTAKIGATPITTGVITITQSGSAAGDKDTCSPSALKTVAAGDVLSITVGGSNTVSTPAHVWAEITLS